MTAQAFMNLNTKFLLKCSLQAHKAFNGEYIAAVLSKGLKCERGVRPSALESFVC